VSLPSAKIEQTALESAMWLTLGLQFVISARRMFNNVTHEIPANISAMTTTFLRCTVRLMWITQTATLHTLR
jgi:hypothetical protein